MAYLNLLVPERATAVGVVGYAQGGTDVRVADLVCDVLQLERAQTHFVLETEVMGWLSRALQTTVRLEKEVHEVRRSNYIIDKRTRQEILRTSFDVSLVN